MSNTCQHTYSFARTTYSNKIMMTCPMCNHKVLVSREEKFKPTVIILAKWAYYIADFNGIREYYILDNIKSAPRTNEFIIVGEVDGDLGETLKQAALEKGLRETYYLDAALTRGRINYMGRSVNLVDSMMKSVEVPVSYSFWAQMILWAMSLK